MGGWGCVWGGLRLVALGTLLFAWATPDLAAEEPELGPDLAVAPRSPRVRLRDPETARRVRVAVEGARHKLLRDECRELLRVFRDPEGHTLAANLEGRGQAADEHLRGLFFYDGTGGGRCQASGVAAQTSPGSRVVLVCPGFKKLAQKGQGAAENVVIHEMLHTLGLGENPPASTEINAAVARHCGP